MAEQGTAALQALLGPRTLDVQGWHCAVEVVDVRRAYGNVNVLCRQTQKLPSAPDYVKEQWHAAERLRGLTPEERKLLY